MMVTFKTPKADFSAVKVSDKFDKTEPTMEEIVGFFASNP